MKTKKPLTKAFTTRLDACTGTDELRPVMSRIHFHEDNILVTNGHILIKIPLSRFGFTPEDIAMLNGHSLHHSQFPLVYKKELTVEPGALIIRSVEFETTLTIKLRPTDKDDLHLVNYFPQVIPTKEQFSNINQIGINPNLLSDLYKALGCKYSVKLHFSAENRSIFVESNDYKKEDKETWGVGVIMPVMINDNR